jgi:hypothetical protein
MNIQHIGAWGKAVGGQELFSGEAESPHFIFGHFFRLTVGIALTRRFSTK